MDFYNESDRAFSLTPAKMASFKSTIPSPLGFFLRSDLRLLLSGASAIGLRFYNVVTSTIVSRALANGSEFQFFYLQSRSIFGSNLTQNAIFHNRANANQLANSAAMDSRYSSFFSKSAMESLLAEPSDGIVLYQYDLNNAMNSDFLSPQDPIIEADRTHLITNTTLINGMLPPEFDENAANRVSNHPCPGHCLHTNNKTKVSRSTQSTSNPGDPYLFRWQ